MTRGLDIKDNCACITVFGAKEKQPTPSHWLFPFSPFESEYI